MLYPKIQLATGPHICTCGAPNFRHSNEHGKIHKIYEVVIPHTPCGQNTYFLCEKCIKTLQPPEGDKND